MSDADVDQTSNEVPDDEGDSTSGPLLDPNVEVPVPVLGGFNVWVRPGYHREGLALIASHQRGRATRRQMLEAGWTPKAIKSAIRRRQIHSRRRGVYAVGHIAPTELGAETEALLEVGAGARLVGCSVLAFHEVIPAAGDPAADEIHVGVSGRRPRKRVDGVRVHYFSGLDVEINEGLPMTSVARALLDAATEIPDLGRVVDEAVVALRKTTNAQIRRVLAANPGHPGHGRLTAVLDARRPAARTESPPAQKLVELIRAAGLPEPETEVSLYGYRADNYWRELGLVVEVDSFSYHGMIRKNYKRDRVKDRVFHAHGLEVMRLDTDEIGQEPLKVIAEISAAITRLGAARAA